MTSLNYQEFLFNPAVHQGSREKGLASSALALEKTVSEFYPAYVTFEMSEEEGILYYERCTVRLIHHTLSLTIRNYNDKHFTISCENFDKMKVTSYQVTAESEKIGKPQNIGVLKTKKIYAWITYYEKLYEVTSAMDANNRNALDEFLQSLFPLEVSWSNDKKTGTVKRNGIVFLFRIETSYVSMNLSLDYGISANLDSFLKLSDNKY